MARPEIQAEAAEAVFEAIKRAAAEAQTYSGTTHSAVVRDVAYVCG